MVVTWVTMNSTGVSFVEYGLENLDSLAEGNEQVFIDEGSESRHIFMHRVTMQGLKAGKRYGRYSGTR